MDGDTRPEPRVIGTLRSADGRGVVRVEDRYPTEAEDLWSALTDPERLARWYGAVAGDLREGGQFSIYLAGPDLDAVGTVEACDPPRRLRLTTRETDESARKGGGRPFEQTVEATLTPDGNGTLLVVEVSGLPLHQIAAYGVGWQLHAERLSAHLTGADEPDVGARWGQLASTYERMAAHLRPSPAR